MAVRPMPVLAISTAGGVPCQCKGSSVLSMELEGCSMVPTNTPRRQKVSYVGHSFPLSAS